MFVGLMVQVILKNRPAFLWTCSNCNALLTYQTNDIYESHFIYCPICKSKEHVLFELNYDGVIKNEKQTTPSA